MSLDNSPRFASPRSCHKWFGRVALRATRKVNSELIGDDAVRKRHNNARKHFSSSLTVGSTSSLNISRRSSVPEKYLSILRRSEEPQMPRAPVNEPPAWH